MSKWLFKLVMAGALCALASPALAHAMLERAAPRVGEIVHVSPTQLRLEFSEGVEPSISRVTLADAQNAQIPLGTLSTEPGNRRVLLASIRGVLRQGVYHVTWRVVSVDTHVTQGDFRFTVAP